MNKKGCDAKEEGRGGGPAATAGRGKEEGRGRGGKGGGKPRSRSSSQNETKPVKVSCQTNDSRLTLRECVNYCGCDLPLRKEMCLDASRASFKPILVCYSHSVASMVRQTCTMVLHTSINMFNTSTSFCICQVIGSVTCL